MEHCIQKLCDTVVHFNEVAAGSLFSKNIVLILHFI